jgi:hypothetical protein
MPDSCVAACVSAAGDTRGPALANTSSNAYVYAQYSS